MPAIALHPPAASRATSRDPNPLPHLLQTPSGLALVEIQGTVNSTFSNGNSEPSDYDNAIRVGRLTFPLYDASAAPAGETAWQKRVHLYVGGYQRLTGEVRKLTKPVAVLRRRECEDLEVAEIVYYKVLFAHRPEPVGGVADG